jgi:Tfp pilus assembly protein PilO
VKKNVKMQKNLMIVVIAVCGVLVLALGWLVLIGPKQKHIADLNAQTVAVQQQISDDLSRAAEARGATNAPTIKTADIYKLETAMPSIVDMPDLLLEIDQTAKAAGVSLDSITPSAPTDDSSGYTKEHVALSVEGNFYTVTDLIYRLRNLVYVRGGVLQASGRIFAIDSVTLNPNGKLLTAQIELDTYVYGSASPASSATPSATPASTTGTTTTATTTTPASGPSAAGATP